MKYIFITIIAISLFFVSRTIIFAQPDVMENPDRYYIDSGEGYGVNPGDNTKKPADEVFQDFLDIFIKPRPTTSLSNGSSNTAPSSKPQVTETNKNGTTTPEITGVPSETPEGKPIDQTFTALQTFYDYVGGKVGVPTCVIEAISYMEFTTVFNYSPDQVNQYIQPGQVIPNCPWNSCSAAGHMQMTMGTDDKGSPACNRCCWNGNCLNSCPNAWASYGNAVNEYDGANHQAHVCNLRDSTFAAAKKLKKDSGTAPTFRNWDQQAIYEAGRRYFGECKTPFSHLGNRTYCEFIIHQCTL